MVCIVLLQNDQLLVYITQEIMQAIFNDEYLELPPCVTELKCGMDTLGIPMFGRQYPMLLYLPRTPSIINMLILEIKGQPCGLSNLEIKHVGKLAIIGTLLKAVKRSCVHTMQGCTHTINHWLLLHTYYKIAKVLELQLNMEWLKLRVLGLHASV